jgi:hypothetical protein
MKSDDDPGELNSFPAEWPPMPLGELNPFQLKASDESYDESFYSFGPHHTAEKLI